jgi:hypothetical protein
MCCHSSMGGNADSCERLAERPGNTYHGERVAQATKIRLQLYQRGKFFFPNLEVQHLQIFREG